MRSFLLVVASALFTTAATAQVSPIWLKPGQCILVGGQQICAQIEDKSGTNPLVPEKPKVTVMNICKWGAADDAHEGVKGYGLYRVMIKEDGTKVETLVKSYGPVDQEGCEKDAKAK